MDPNLACSVCGKADNDSEMLVCDGCVEGFHLGCVGLEAVPDTAEWSCHGCSSVLRTETQLMLREAQKATPA